MTQKLDEPDFFRIGPFRVRNTCVCADKGITMIETDANPKDVFIHRIFGREAIEPVDHLWQ